MTLAVKNMVPVDVVTRVLDQTEIEILSGKEQLPFIVKDLDGNELLSIPSPKTGWTHDLLEGIRIDYDIWVRGCDFYLRQFWIGSSEI